MLSTIPALFNFNGVKFKELDDMSTLEKVFFEEFIFNSYSQFESRRLSWAKNSSDEVLVGLQSTFVDVPRWAIKSGEEFVGFWFIADDENINAPRVDSYVAPMFVGGQIDYIILEIASRLSKETSAPFFISVDKECESQVEAFSNFVENIPDDGLIPCRSIVIDSYNPELNDCYDFIRDSYIA